MEAAGNICHHWPLTTMSKMGCYLWHNIVTIGHVSKIVGLLLSKLSDCLNSDTSLCYCNNAFLTVIQYKLGFVIVPCTCSSYSYSHPVIPADIDVTITTESATSHGGQEFILTCTVTTVEGLLYQPEVEWLNSARRPIGTEGDITVGNPVISGLTTTITLQFSPLRLSHDGDITCRANITSLAPPYNLSREAEREIIVGGEYCGGFSCYLSNHLVANLHSASLAQDSILQQ